MGGCYKIPAIDLTFEGVFTNKICTDRIQGRRQAGGDLLDRADDGQARGTARTWIRSSCGGRTSSSKASSRSRPRWGSPTTRATTTARSTACSSGFDLEAIPAGASRPPCDAASTAGSASRPMSRCAGSRRRGWWGRKVWGCRPRSGSRRWCASTRLARRPSTPAPRRTARATTPDLLRSPRIAWASIPSGSRSFTAIPTRVPGGGAPTARGRSTVGGESVARAAEKVQEKAKEICAALLKGDPEDIELVDGKFSVRGSPDKFKTMAEIAGAAHIPPQELPTDIEPGLEATSQSTTPRTSSTRSARTRAWSTSTPRPARFKVVRYVAVDDCGPAINPMLIDGQIHGGVTHAIGQALYEQIPLRRGRPARYRDVRRLRASRRRRRLPELRDGPHRDAVARELARRQRGSARQGTIGATPAITAAVLDALANRSA